MKKIAHLIHHTHWDPLWYFTKEDALVQFSHNFKELLKGLDEQRIKTFFLDGQSYVIDEYLTYHPEDLERVKTYVKSKRLFIGPFYNQIDAFITSGESVIQNLKSGMTIANDLGGSSKIAYLPDSFGHSVDFPKLFNFFGIHDFVITRGVGDEYNLDNEFYFMSDDGSKVLTAVMLAGYGYGTYSFKDGTLLSSQAEDYNKLNVHRLIDRLIKRSSIKNAFVFPLGFDQNPAIFDIDKKINIYNQAGPYTFKETTWEAYLNYVRHNVDSLKTHKDELYSTQYHRIHRTLFSARSDIKTIQDAVERRLTYEVAPLYAMLNSIGVNSELSLIEKAWKMLHEGQTHASATVTDTVNEAIKARSLSALYLSDALKHHAMKLIARSIPLELKKSPVVIFSTHPDTQTKHHCLKIRTKHKIFKLMQSQNEIAYTLLSTKEVDGNVLANHLPKDSSKIYYEHDIVIKHTEKGVGYETVWIHDGEVSAYDEPVLKHRSIENEDYVLTFDTGIQLKDKSTNTVYHKAFYLEDSGDQGDNYDFDSPKEDWIIKDYFENIKSIEGFESNTLQRVKVRGEIAIPYDLHARAKRECNAVLSYEITFELDSLNHTISIKGVLNNTAKNHRLRFVFNGNTPNDHSLAGTQFSVVERPTQPTHLQDWKQQGFFEAPVPVYPLLNFVSLKQDNAILTVYTRSVKEYEVIGENYQQLAVTLFRSVGHLGQPDLFVRPGRPSGIDNKIIETPMSQLIGEQTFDLVFALNSTIQPNEQHKMYANIAINTLYHQHQRFDKTEPLIAYFPINPLEKKPPESYKHMSLELKDLAYGTLYKTKDNYEILRVFNANQKVVAINPYPFTHNVNGLDEILTELKDTIELKAGQVCSFKRVV